MGPTAATAAALHMQTRSDIREHRMSRLQCTSHAQHVSAWRTDRSQSICSSHIGTICMQGLS